ncbi:hypothetical protein LEP1GSC158_0919 [Leptospira interrogans serovar Zanoni str. LT2156]|uniref:Uncharacterized protein n=1 Tax=Leptospira interrogans serovar Zanoni str. LT2156 TaxID=1001601 RepID=M6HWK7_LEPIR|nr:hypothetical protein LEP1GSC158_0919 [Leptospira interrogans serovar Zanoni str. LT2156]
MSFILFFTIKQIFKNKFLTLNLHEQRILLKNRIISHLYLKNCQGIP